MSVPRDRLRRLPSVDEVLRGDEAALLLERFPRWAVTAAVREAIDDRRREVRDGVADEGPDLPTAARLEALVARRLRPSLIPVVNATGVVVHTNLGRAPLAAAALARVVEVAGGYSTLEYDLAAGRRGSRHGHVQRLAAELCGAQDAVVANNNAAAVLLAISALAAGREVVVSRGELVEIGGGFRIPEVIVQGGARLREVGTTNRTRLRDYAAAIGPETGALLKVHRSNFDVVGFTEEASVAQLAGLAKEAGLPLVDDLGSGAMTARYGPGLTGEPEVRRALADGADLVCFSGDKLLGGPQAGLVLGKADLVERVRRHPLLRALRPCKLTLAALEATLALWRDGRQEEIPVVAMLAQPADEAKARAKRFLGRLRRAGLRCTGALRPVEGRAGGGSMPLRTAPGWAVALSFPATAPDVVEASLRDGEPPVIGRIVDDLLLLDLRTVLPAQEAVVLGRLAEVDARLRRAEAGP
jgi:L-seryl-tRNA(Ser) seleniumtransferase